MKNSLSLDNFFYPSFEVSCTSRLWALLGWCAPVNGHSQPRACPGCARRPNAEASVVSSPNGFQVSRRGRPWSLPLGPAPAAVTRLPRSLGTASTYDSGWERGGERSRLTLVPSLRTHELTQSHRPWPQSWRPLLSVGTRTCTRTHTVVTIYGIHEELEQKVYSCDGRRRAKGILETPLSGCGHGAWTSS